MHALVAKENGGMFTPGFTYVTVLAKTRHVRTKTEFNFIAAVY